MKEENILYVSLSLHIECHYASW